MTIMNGKVRAELTRLLIDHLNEQHRVRIIQGQEYSTSLQYFERVAEDVMDFMYGSEDGDVPQSECETHQEAGAVRDDQGDSGSASCCNGFTCGCCPGGVDRLDGGPVGPNVTYGVVTPRESSFVYLGRPSPTEAYVRLPRSNFGPYLRSPQESDSAGE